MHGMKICHKTLLTVSHPCLHHCIDVFVAATHMHINFEEYACHGELWPNMHFFKTYTLLPNSYSLHVERVYGWMDQSK